MPGHVTPNKGPAYISIRIYGLTFSGNGNPFYNEPQAQAMALILDGGSKLLRACEGKQTFSFMNLKFAVKKMF